MTAAVVAEFVRGHTIDALVFSVVGASGIAAVAAVLTRARWPSSLLRGRG
jgi:hypothetical protein